MKWFYVQNGQQQGPVSEADLDALVRSGFITSDTLVWREGMANWTPYRVAREAVATTRAVPAAGAPLEGRNQSACAECGALLPATDLISLDGRLICARCKPVVVQRMKEGVSSSSPVDREALINEVLARDYDVPIGSCLSRSIGLIKARFWLTVGTTLLVYFCVAIVGQIPCAQFFLQGPLLAGLFWFFIKLHRQQPATVGDGFSGFGPHFVPLMLNSIVTSLVMLAILIPGLIPIFIAAAGDKEPPLWSLGGFLLALIPVTYLGTAWLFSLPLVIDKKLGFWDAMEVSRRVINRHWWKVFALLLVCGLIVSGVLVVIALIAIALAAALGSAGSGVGAALVALVVVVMILLGFCALALLAPLAFGAIAAAYEDIFGASRTPATT